MTPEAEEKARAAMEQGFMELVRKGANKYFSSPKANRFFLQALGDGSIAITIGSIGTLTSEDGTIEPISDVIGTFNVDMSFLWSLAKVIGETFPQGEDT